MKKLTTALASELFRHHDFVMNREQLLADGVPRTVIDLAIRNGVILQLHPGVYVVAGTMVTWRMRVRASFLYVERQARRKWQGTVPRPVVAVTGVAAARIHDFPHLDEDPETTVLVSNPRSRAKGALILPRSGLSESDVVVQDGLTLTCVIWTLLELIPILLPSHARNICADMFRDGRASLSACLAMATRIPEIAEWTVPFLRSLTPEQLAARSEAERRLFEGLVRRGVMRPLINHIVSTALRSFELDLVWPDLMLNVELDGPHHRETSQRRLDEIRDAALRHDGWEVLRIDIDDLDRNLEAVLGRIEAAIRERQVGLASR